MSLSSYHWTRSCCFPIHKFWHTIYYCNGTLALPFFISYPGIYLTLYSIDKCPTISCFKHLKNCIFQWNTIYDTSSKTFFFFFWQYKYITVLTVLLGIAFKLKFCQHVSKVSLVFMHCL